MIAARAARMHPPGHMRSATPIRRPLRPPHEPPPPPSPPPPACTCKAKHDYYGMPLYGCDATLYAGGPSRSG